VSQTSTPAAKWLAEGQPDPHAGQYDCDRVSLALGHLTDDELANAVFLGGNEPLNIERVLARDPDYFPAIGLLTAGKDRIRWLSRKLTAADAQRDELLAALETALAALEGAEGDINPERGYADELEEEVSTAVGTVRAAIAAAKGGAQ
jgi:hypothetical protein